MASHRIWIMDGHNMIFAIPGLQQLQVSDRREEARSGLTDRLGRFALTRGEKVLVVFDGHQMSSNPDATRHPLLEVAYGRPGEGGADDRIIREAGRCLERGLVVTVVTDDLNTLAGKLPRGVLHLGVRAFWLKHIEKDVGKGGKQVAGDFSDVEREMMVQAATAEAALRVRESSPFPGRAGRGAVTPSGPGARYDAPGADAWSEQVRRKRARGRLRQEHRLKQCAKPQRRR